MDYSKNGPNKENCHYRLFSTQELLEFWEEGRKAGEILVSGGRGSDLAVVSSRPSGAVSLIIKEKL